MHGRDPTTLGRSAPCADRLRAQPDGDCTMATRVGYFYDAAHVAHNSVSHPENSTRLTETLRTIERLGLNRTLVQIASTPATLDQILAVHTAQEVDLVRAASAQNRGFLDPDTYVTPDSFEAALRAAGGSIACVDAVLSGQVASAYALVRPPGHHATPQRPMGFCLFNNVAIAARHAIQRYGLRRILIVDFDVHHGNGTQDAFYDSPDVLYFSTHEYPFYPGSGDLREVGSGPGVGYTVNVPLPPDCGDDEYRAVYRDVLVLVARRYAPELILVSAGYDPHWSDPLANMRVSVGGFRDLLSVISLLAAESCQGRLVMTLEGGYNVQALSDAIATSLYLLQGEDTVVDTLGPAAAPARRPDVQPIIEAARRTHRLND
ncbi:MAG: histone deacetylase [Chloroflexota bacterium]|nr:MAG: histone deacetylase [Chloroflexota bacterium]